MPNSLLTMLTPKCQPSFPEEEETECQGVQVSKLIFVSALMAEGELGTLVVGR